MNPGVSLQAYHWYELGHQRGHFASVWQRSLYNVNGLKAQPWWTAKEAGYTDLVKVRRRKAFKEHQRRFISLVCPSDVGEELEDDQGRGSGCDGPELRRVRTWGREPERERAVGAVHAVAAREKSWELMWGRPENLLTAGEISWSYRLQTRTGEDLLLLAK